jgi:hypothetical protein
MKFVGYIESDESLILIDELRMMRKYIFRAYMKVLFQHLCGVSD